MQIPNRIVIVLVLATALALAGAACTTGDSSQPLAPSSSATTAVPDASLKASTPTPQSPVNDQRLSTLNSVTLVAGTAAGQFTSLTLQYRFQLFNDVGVSVGDSGLMASPTSTFSTTLTPLARYTWRVRAEYQGTAGSWSAPASFTTPEQPPAYNRPIGSWEGCGSLKTTTLVQCVWNAVRPTDTVSGFEVTKRVAWLLRGDGAGLLIKTGGENTIVWQGYSFSASRICFVATGRIFKVLGDAGPGGANNAEFEDNGTTDPSQCVPAIDPSRP